MSDQQQAELDNEVRWLAEQFLIDAHKLTGDDNGLHAVCWLSGLDYKQIKQEADK